jgi:hypothetical protein
MGGLGQAQHAVGAGAVGQGILEVEGLGRQGVAHQGLQLHLAEGAAGALVAQQLLQADHVGGEIADLLLGLVDGGEAGHHAGEGLVGLAEALVEALVDVAGDGLQALADGAVHGLNAVGELLGGALEAALQQLPVGTGVFGEGLEGFGHHLAAQFFLTRSDGAGQLGQAQGVPSWCLPSCPTKARWSCWRA